MRLFPKVWLFLLLALLSVDVFALPDPPFKLPRASELNKIRTAKLMTTEGTLWIELYPEDAPWHVANLKYLADKGFYTNKPFHIFIPGFAVQTGATSARDPESGPGYELPAEFTDMKHEFGTLGMARIKGPNNPERRSNGSQFYILLADAPHLDGSFTIFGKVIEGFDALRRLTKRDRITSLTVYVKN